MLCMLLGLAGCRNEERLSVRELVPPQYPGVARLYHLAGSVNVRVEVGPDGKVLSAKGSGSAPVLVEAAERNVALWQFDVPKKGPYPIVRTIIYDFRLTGKPSTQGLTSVEFTAPNHVTVVDQPFSERIPESIIPGERIDDRFDFDTLLPALLEHFRDDYKRCHGTAPSPDLTLGQLIDESKHCEQELKDMVAQEKANQLRAREKQRPGSGPK